MTSDPRSPPMSTTETWTIGRLLTWTTDYLKQHGADSPRLDAEVLLAEARGCKRIELYTAFAEEADEKTRAAFRESVRRRAEGPCDEQQQKRRYQGRNRAIFQRIAFGVILLIKPIGS